MVTRGHLASFRLTQAYSHTLRPPRGHLGPFSASWPSPLTSFHLFRSYFSSPKPNPFNQPISLPGFFPETRSFSGISGNNCKKKLNFLAPRVFPGFSRVPGVDPGYLESLKVSQGLWWLPRGIWHYFNSLKPTLIHWDHPVVTSTPPQPLGTPLWPVFTYFSSSRPTPVISPISDLLWCKK